MGKIVYVAPPLKTALEPGETAEVTIKEVRIVKDQYTSIGTLTFGIGIQVEYQGELYSQLFSLDRPVVTGSAGRLLASVGIADTEDPQFEAKVQRLVGKKVRVINKGGKLYWYP
jgi:hypothetical protein